MEDFILLVQYFILGLVQGITEPIPISSSGHVFIFRELFGIEARGLSFEIFVNTASLLAVLVIYRNDIIRLTTNGWKYITKKEEDAKSDFRFIIYLIIATIPVGIIGLLLKDVVGDINPMLVGVTLLVTAFFLWLIKDLRGKKLEGDLTMKDAIIVGLGQAIAVVPGISRSGASIVPAMLRGMNQKTALRFAFLLYIPVSVGTAILGIPDLLNDPNLNNLIIPYSIAFITTFIATYFALKWFMGVMERGNLKYFAYYCVIAGVLVILFL